MRRLISPGACLCKPSDRAPTGSDRLRNHRDRRRQSKQAARRGRFFDSLLAPLVLSVFLALATPVARAEDPGIEPELVAIETLRRSGKTEDAARQAGALIASHPEQLEAHVAFQDLQGELGDGKKLLAAYRKKAKAPESTADDRYLYGRLLVGRPAVLELRAATKLDPGHFWAHCGLGAELTALGKFKPAAVALDRAATIRPKSAVPLNLLARLAEAQGDGPKAEQLYRKAMETDPGFTLARVNLGVLLVGTGRYGEARTVLEAASKAAPQDPLPLVGLGMAALGAGEPKQAAEAFEQAIALDSHSVASLNLLANAYFNLQRLDLAEKALESALALDGKHVETRVAFAHLYLLRGENGRARLEIRKALEIDADFAVAHFMLGLYHERERDTRKAESAYQKGAKLDPDNPVFPRALALLYESQTRWRDAIRAREKVADLTDGSAAALNALGLAQFSAKKHKDAVRTFEDVLRASPDDLTALLNLGILCHHHVRDRKRAAQAYRAYIDKGGDEARVPEWLADVEGR